MTDHVGATITLVGWAASDGRSPKYDADGSKGIKEVSIPINEGYKGSDGDFVKTGTSWYSVTAAGEYAAQIAAIKQGDKIKVEGGKLEVREYKDKDGNEKLGLNVRYGKITVLESKSGGAPAAGSNDDSW